MEVRLDRISHTQFLAAFNEAKSHGRSTQNYLLCKAAAERRRQQAELLKEHGVDTSDLERMIKHLEASMAVHKRAMTRDTE